MIGPLVLFATQITGCMFRARRVLRGEAAGLDAYSSAWNGWGLCNPPPTGLGSGVLFANVTLDYQEFG